jgi:hypothetical protein
VVACRGRGMLGAAYIGSRGSEYEVDEVDDHDYLDDEGEVKQGLKDVFLSSFYCALCSKFMRVFLEQIYFRSPC